MNHTINQNQDKNQNHNTTKSPWEKPVLETCNIEQTMASTKSGVDGGSPQT